MALPLKPEASLEGKSGDVVHADFKEGKVLHTWPEIIAHAPIERVKSADSLKVVGTLAATGLVLVLWGGKELVERIIKKPIL